MLNVFLFCLVSLPISYLSANVTHSMLCLIRSNNSSIRRGGAVAQTHVGGSGTDSPVGWLRGPAVEHRSLADVLSLSCDRLVADG